MGTRLAGSSSSRRRALVRQLVVAALASGAAVAVAATGGCTLTTSFDGLSGGPVDTVDGAPGVPISSEAGPDGGPDATVPDGAVGTDAMPDEAGANVGRLYVFGGVGNVGGAVATVLVADIHADGSLGAWVGTASLPEARSYAEAVAGQGFLAVVGGSGPSGYSTSALIAKTTSTGLGDWSALGQFAIPRIRHGATITNDRLYVIGGTDVSDAAIVDVQFATISATTVGTFASTASLPVPRSRVAVASTTKNIYVFGGSDAASNAVADVYRAPINIDGTLGTFTTTSPLPSPRTHAQATVVATNHILITGGENVTDDALVYDIDTVQGTLGAPRGTLALPAPTDHHATVAFGDHVYVIGGFRNNATRLTDVLVGDVAADGTITRWTPTTSLPMALAYHTAAAF